MPRRVAWYKNGELHNTVGPAVMYDNSYRAWYINGNSHREDGPAVISENGEHHWFVRGKKLTEREFYANNRKTIHHSIDYEITDFSQ